MTKINFDRILHDLFEKKAREDSRLLPTPATRREPSATEKNSTWRPAAYGLLFCCHGKSYFDVCPNCQRTRLVAQKHYAAFLKRHGLE